MVLIQIFKVLAKLIDSILLYFIKNGVFLISYGNLLIIYNKSSTYYLIGAHFVLGLVLTAHFPFESHSDLHYSQMTHGIIKEFSPVSENCLLAAHLSLFHPSPVHHYFSLDYCLVTRLLISPLAIVQSPHGSQSDPLKQKSNHITPLFGTKSYVLV